MGNSASSSGRGHHEDTVDFGFLTPQGVYTGPRDWNQPIVSQLICQRRLAPFYRPLEDYEESWDEDQILAARKELPLPEGADSSETASRHESITSHASSKHGHNKRPSSLKEPSKPEAAIYRGAVECPICFLYYPPNINRSRCCDQAICTECFVQIKRSEPTTTHLVSEPAACPYCVQDNFGIVYKPPPWRAGIGSDNSSLWTDSPKGSPQPNEPGTAPYPTHKRRQKSFGADSPEVVTIDQIRPDWEAKLAAVQATVARRANRRIIMRQVGDRLIPVGITSGRVHALSPEEAAAAAAHVQGHGDDDHRGSRRRRRREERQQPQGFEQLMGMSGQELEELMVMEAIRLSIAEHEEHQRKEAEEKTKKEAEAAKAGGGSSEPASEGASSSSDPTTTITPSTPQIQSIPVPAPIPVPVPAHTSTRATDATFLSPDSAQPVLSGSLPGSMSRRSPSPSPASTQVSSSQQSQSNIPAPGGNQSQGKSHSRTPSWNLTRRTPSPQPQYGALGAALTGAASTAGAILKSSGSTTEGQAGPNSTSTDAGPASLAASGIASASRNAQVERPAEDDPFADPGSLGGPKGDSVAASSA